MWLKELLDDSHGRLSSVRMMSFLALFQAMFYTDWCLITATTIQWEVLSIWLTAGFGGKVAQRFAERGKDDKTNTVK